MHCVCSTLALAILGFHVFVIIVCSIRCVCHLQVLRTCYRLYAHDTEVYVCSIHVC